VQVFDFGMRKHKVAANIARALVGWAEIPPKQNRAWLKESEMPEFFRALESYTGYPSTIYAIKILLHTFVRKGELLSAQWDEFDLDNALWVVPAQRMKMSTEKKSNRHNSHDVPLSRQTIDILRELKPMCAGSNYLFPSNSSLEKPISHSTLNVAYNRMGYARLFTPHGIRSTASTILNERGFDSDWVERQLAHIEQNSSRAAYNHAKYLAERRKMMQTWSDLLTELSS
jgi:integrase